MVVSTRTLVVLPKNGSPILWPIPQNDNKGIREKPVLVVRAVIPLLVVLLGVLKSVLLGCPSGRARFGLAGTAVLPELPQTVYISLKLRFTAIII